MYNKLVISPFLIPPTKNEGRMKEERSSKTIYTQNYSPIFHKDDYDLKFFLAYSFISRFC